MAGFHLPGDPYFPDEGNNGWLNEEPEEDFEEDPEEEFEEEPEEEIEEDPEGNIEVDFEEDEEMEEGDSEAESEVYDPPYPVRERNAPLPPPDFQVYRHPGGQLWRRTPRKRVLPIHHPLLIREPLQDQTPEWAERIRIWCHEQGLVTPYGMSRDIGNGTSADRALPVMVGRISRHDEQIRATTSQIMDVGATAETTAARLRRLDEAHDHTSRRIDPLEDDVQTAIGMWREVILRVSDSEESIREIARRAEEAEREAAELRAQVDALRKAKGPGSS
ncbi:hypothetical protein L1887_11706 [Cichorium endivia]|nr:hypothetical protein L1887_11706 [Cichorium endivia]